MHLALLTLTSSFALKRTQIILSNTSFMPHDNLSVAPRRAVAIVKSSLEWMCLKIFTLPSAQQKKIKIIATLVTITMIYAMHCGSQKLAPLINTFNIKK